MMRKRRKFNAKKSLKKLFLKHVVTNSKEGILTISNARGSAEAKTVLIAPPTDELEYANNLPFTGEVARYFHNLLLENTGVSTEDFFVIPFHSYSVLREKTGELKIPKDATLGVVDFIQEAAKLGLIKGVVTVGGDAFKYTFGRGKKAQMQSLSGNVLFDSTINNLPIFVFPDIRGLKPDFTGEYGEDRKKKIWQEETVRELLKAIQRFKTANKEHGFV